MTDDNIPGHEDLPSVGVPPEVLDLVRYLAATWSEIDDWAYGHCDPDTLAGYPVIQGTAIQMKLRRIARQPHSNDIGKAVEWMLSHDSM